jgi:hypothetical protein
MAVELRARPLLWRQGLKEIAKDPRRFQPRVVDVLHLHIVKISVEAETIDPWWRISGKTVFLPIRAGLYSH